MHALFKCKDMYLEMLMLKPYDRVIDPQVFNLIAVDLEVIISGPNILLGI